MQCLDLNLMPRLSNRTHSMLNTHCKFFSQCRQLGRGSPDRGRDATSLGFRGRERVGGRQKRSHIQSKSNIYVTISAYAVKQSAGIMHGTLHQPLIQHTCCSPVPALAVAVVSPIHCSRSWAPPTPRHFTHSKVAVGLRGGRY